MEIANLFKSVKEVKFDKYTIKIKQHSVAFAEYYNAKLRACLEYDSEGSFKNISASKDTWLSIHGEYVLEGILSWNLKDKVKADTHSTLESTKEQEEEQEEVDIPLTLESILVLQDQYNDFYQCLLGEIRLFNAMIPDQKKRN